MGPLGELGALFNPGMRHEMEERRAKQMLREEEGTGRKGTMRIDLESGVAVIPGKPGKDGEEPAGAYDDEEPAGPVEEPAGPVDEAARPVDEAAGDETLTDTDGSPTNDRDANDSHASESGTNGSHTNGSHTNDGHTNGGDEATDSRIPAARGTAAGTRSKSKPAVRPGEPQPAARSAGSVPAGKARRRLANSPNTPPPAGTSRRAH